MLSWLYAITALFAAQATSAAQYPDRPVRVIVSVAPGGGTDIVARQIANKLGQLWHQPVVVENRPGAGGNIGAVAVARAKPDGYTLLLTFGSNVMLNPRLYKDAGFSPQDFVPVIELASAPFLISVNHKVPVETFPQLVSFLKQRKDAFYFCGSQPGSLDHLAGELLNSSLGTDMTFVPYKGTAPALQAVVGGFVQMAISSIPASLPFAKERTIRPLAVTSSKRSAMMPDVPTVAETIPGYEILNWYGIWAPAGTPAEIVEAVYATSKQALDAPEVKAFLESNGFNTVGSRPAEFAGFVREETAKYTALLDKAGVKQLD
jgi:tripartite-type tricarboxylate transporter receptor subunit TctC